jgi:FtsZ-interacting cell division protein YlmF
MGGKFMGAKVKSLWHKITARETDYDGQEQLFDEEGNALDMDYQNETYDNSMSSSSEKILRFTGSSERHNLRLYKLEGHNWGVVAKKASDDLKNGCSVMINTESANKDAVTRMADFMGGVAYAIEGRMVKHGSTWAFVPENCELGGDIYEENGYPFEGLFE